MVKLKELRSRARGALAGIDNEDYMADIDVLLGSFGFSKGEILLGDASVDEKTEAEFWAGVERLGLGEPVQYIVGKCEFMSMDFFVNSHTLIPRADTEVLVEETADLLKEKTAPRIFEVGSGSGCIAVSLAKLLPKATVVSVDISPDAIKVAQKNAEANGVADRVEFVRCDIFDGFLDFAKDADAVVSNPPYIPKADIDGLDQKVKDFEPVGALDGGDDGLDFYRFMCRNTPQRSGSYLAFEVGIGQARDVAELMAAADFENIRIIPDLAGIDRVVVGVRKYDKNDWASPTLKEAPFWRDGMTPEEYNVEREYFNKHWDEYTNGEDLPLWKQKAEAK